MKKSVKSDLVCSQKVCVRVSVCGCVRMGVRVLFGCVRKRERNRRKRRKSQRKCFTFAFLVRIWSAHFFLLFFIFFAKKEKEKSIATRMREGDTNFYSLLHRWLPMVNKRSNKKRYIYFAVKQNKRILG